MAFPYIFQDDFESGSNAGWDSETDTGSQLDFPSYRTLAGMADAKMAPYRGSYCMRATLAGGTADAFVTEGDINIAASETRYFRFYIKFSEDFTSSGVADTVPLLEIQSAGNTVEAVVGFKILAGVNNNIKFAIGDTAPTSLTDSIDKSKWHCNELAVTLDSGGGNDGTIDLYVTPEGSAPTTTVAATQVASLDQAAVTHAVLGVQDHLATSQGTILFDEFAFDDARLFDLRRWDTSRLLTKTGHALVGPGKVSPTLASGGAADNILRVYDTDAADTNAPLLYEVRNTAGDETVESRRDIYVRKGAYVELSGTNPRAFVEIQEANVYGSTGAYRNYGLAAR